MKISHDELTALIAPIFTAAGCSPREAGCIAGHLVEANLVGHDSHGMIRIPLYMKWLQAGAVVPNQEIATVYGNEVVTVLDGRGGFGQTIGEQAVRVGIDKCRRYGVSVVALRNAGHLGRIGDWPETAAAENVISLHFVNTNGAGVLVAPTGGIDRRLSANPIAVGVPVKGRRPIVLDMSSCTIAEGKIRVALNRGVKVPDGCLIDAEGNPTNDPPVFYADPPGAILPIAGHKGYGLSLIIEMLAGALTGGGCTNPEKHSKLRSGMLSVYLDPTVFDREDGFPDEVHRFIDFVKSSRKVSPDGRILVPGEIESLNKDERLRDGIDLDDRTLQEIREAARSVGVAFDPRGMPG